MRVMELIAKLKDVVSHLVLDSPGSGNECGTDRDLVGERDHPSMGHAFDIYRISNVPIDGFESAGGLEACLRLAVPNGILWRDRHHGPTIHEARMRTKQTQSARRDRWDKDDDCSAQHVSKVLEMRETSSHSGRES